MNTSMPEKSAPSTSPDRIVGGPGTGWPAAIARTFSCGHVIAFAPWRVADRCLCGAPRGPLNSGEASDRPLSDEPSLAELQGSQSALCDELPDTLGTDAETVSRLIDGEVHGSGRDAVVVPPVGPVLVSVVLNLRLVEGVDGDAVPVDEPKVTDEFFRDRLTSRLGRFHVFHDISIAHPQGFVKSHLKTGTRS